MITADRTAAGPMLTFAAPGEEISLTPLLSAGAAPDDWTARRAEIAARWAAVLGAEPDPVDLRTETEVVDRTAEFTTYRVSFAAADDDRVIGLLLVPPGSGLPAVLALHQTVAQGKREPAGLEGNPDLAYALELARRGYVVLAPDEFVAGERAPERAYYSAAFDARYPNWSGVGKMLHDHRQAVSLLATLPTVDPQRIGVIGHSLGGLNAGWLLGADDRIRAAVVSCGFCTFAGDPRPLRWATDDWFHYFHWLRDDLRQRRAPFEHHEIMALVAPRPLYWWATTQDHIFPHWAGVQSAAEEVRSLYRLLGADDRLVFRLGDVGHSFPADIRADAYAFLDRWLAPAS